MRHPLLFCVLGIALVACGDDDEDDAVPARIQELCGVQCQQADGCGFLAGSSLAECQSSCESVQSALTDSACPFSDAELDACSAAFEAQQCSEIEDAVIPDACIKTCAG